MSRNVVRLAIIVWFAISMYSAFTSWGDHQVPLIVSVPVTDANLSGQQTVLVEFECPAAIGGSGEPKLVQDLSGVDDMIGVVGTDREPCEPFVRGRQLLFVVDVVAFVAAMGLTFAHLPRRRREQRATTGHAVTV